MSIDVPIIVLEILATLVSVALYLVLYIRAIINNEVDRVEEEDEIKIIQRKK